MALLHAERLAPLFERRSIRRYHKRPLEPDMVEALLQAAMAAPSACACDPWRFVVVLDPDVLDRVARGLSHGKFLAAAGAGIVVCGDQSAAHDGQESYMLQDCSAAIENLLLAAHLLGLGACWLGVHPRTARIEHLRKVLSIPDPITPVAALAVGYPAAQKPARSRYQAGYVHREGW
jgi:nitroreductase